MLRLLWLPALATVMAALSVAVLHSAGKEKAKDTTPLFTVADLKAINQKDGAGLGEADAKKKWDGKTAEITIRTWVFPQSQSQGKYAGKTLFSYPLGKVKPGEKAPPDEVLAVYVGDWDDRKKLSHRTINDRSPLTLRGKLVVDYSAPARVVMVDARLIPDAKELEKARKELEAGRLALRKRPRTKDGKALVVDVPTLKVMQRRDAKDQEQTRKWEGELVEVVVRGATFSQGPFKGGDHAGRKLYNFEVLEEPRATWMEHTLLVAYFKGEKDTLTIDNWWARRREEPYRVRGKLKTSTRFGWQVWVEDARIERDPMEAAQEEKEIEAGRAALLRPEKTRDGKALLLGIAALKGMQRIDPKNQELAKQKWEGQVVEVAVYGTTSSANNPEKTGPLAGQRSYGFEAFEQPRAKWMSHTVVGAYVKDEGDQESLKKLWRPDRPFRIRGKLHLDPKRPGQFWLADTRLVKDD